MELTRSLHLKMQAHMRLRLSLALIHKLDYLRLVILRIFFLLQVFLMTLLISLTHHLTLFWVSIFPNQIIIMSTNYLDKTLPSHLA